MAGRYRFHTLHAAMTSVPRTRIAAKRLAVRTAAAVTAVCLAFVPFNGTVAMSATHWSAVDDHFGFQGWRNQLQHMADHDGNFPANHFCIVVATGATAAPASSYTWAYVHWREAARLYTFGQSDEAMSDLTEFQAPLDLNKDVVATTGQIGGSTYRVTRAWVRNVLHRCAQAGTQLVVRRSP